MGEASVGSSTDGNMGGCLTKTAERGGMWEDKNNDGRIQTDELKQPEDYKKAITAVATTGKEYAEIALEKGTDYAKDAYAHLQKMIQDQTGDDEAKKEVATQVDEAAPVTPVKTTSGRKGKSRA